MTTATPVASDSQRPSDFRQRVTTVLRQAAMMAPENMRAGQLADIPRIQFHVEESFVSGGAIADLGGGLGLFAPACAALGMNAYLVDDFLDPVNEEHPIERMAAHREFGVNVISTPVNRWGDHFAEGSLDVVTSFDSIEHWHHSPRRVFREAYRILRPGGVLFIGAPNAVNLRKRVTVPFGISNWSTFDEWYHHESEMFRGHVREPVVADLLKIVDDAGFETGSRRIWGRNWAGYAGSRARRTIARLIDAPLRLRPTLCSDIYVMATKPV